MNCKKEGVESCPRRTLLAQRAQTCLQGMGTHNLAQKLHERSQEKMLTWVAACMLFRKWTRRY